MKRCALLLLVLMTASQGQQVFLTGKVMDAAGNALQGSIISLSKLKLNAISDADGVYRISGSPAVRNSILRAPAKACEIVGGILRMDLDAETPVRIDAFSVQGRQSPVISERLFTAGSHTLSLGPMVPRQVGILSVIIGTNRTLFRFVNVGRFTTIHCAPLPGGVAGVLSKVSAVTTMDTLTAASGDNSIKLFVYTYVDTMDFWIGGTDPYTEYRQQCMHRINYYRSLVSQKRLTRNLAKEACVDSQCQSDAGGTAHGAFGKCGEGAQDECPSWGSLVSIVTGCLQQMWDEGAPLAGTPCGGGTACYQQHGRYINMTGPYTAMACGFFVGAGGKIQAIQNFWR